MNINESTKGRGPLCEATWRKAEQNMARRERGRLIRNGTINLRTLPNVMVRDNDGSWKFPSLEPAAQG